MHYTTDSGSRAYFSTALRQLADYLDAHPAVPTPTGTISIVLHANVTEDGGREQVTHIARILGVPVCDATARGGHVSATRRFGPIDYEVCSIPTTVKSWHRAQDSYFGSIATETRQP